MTAEKPARKMSDKVAHRLGSELFAERCTLQFCVDQLASGVSPANAVTIARDAAKSARTIARIARRLAKAGAQ